MNYHEIYEGKHRIGEIFEEGGWLIELPEGVGYNSFKLILIPQYGGPESIHGDYFTLEEALREASKYE